MNTLDKGATIPAHVVYLFNDGSYTEEKAYTVSISARRPMSERYTK